LFISDGAVNYRDLDFQSYVVKRQYKLNIVALFEPQQDSIRVAEAQLRELLNKVENLLKPTESRNAGGWQDLKLISTSEPFNGAEISMSDNTVIREIIVEIEDVESN
jgi:hypothetical protein